MEYLDVLDEKGNQTGKRASRFDVHKNGLWHMVVHVWFINSKDKILLQLRSLEKDNNPGMWDVSVAGHVPAGENDVTGAVRETEEEIGLELKPEDLRYIGKVIHNLPKKKEDFIDKEIASVFIVRKDLDLSELKMQKGEVDELKFISLIELQEMIKNNNKSLVMRLEEFELLFRHLQENI